jgi:predicted nuclease of predicted toxin-antitoxin system
MRWLVDEGTPKLLVDWLIERGDDVLDVAASPLRGSTDRLLWRVAATEERTVLTRDVGFVWQGETTPLEGVVLVRAPDDFRAEALVRLIRHALSSVPQESLRGALTVIQPGRVRQHRLGAVMRRMRSGREG